MGGCGEGGAPAADEPMRSASRCSAAVSRTATVLSLCSLFYVGTSSDHKQRRQIVPDGLSVVDISSLEASASA